MGLANVGCSSNKLLGRLQLRSTTVLVALMKDDKGLDGHGPPPPQRAAHQLARPQQP